MTVLPEDSFMIMVKRGCTKMQDLKHISEDYSGIDWWLCVFKDSPINDVMRGEGRRRPQSNAVNAKVSHASHKVVSIYLNWRP